MKRSLSFAGICLGVGLAVPALAQTGTGQQQGQMQPDQQVQQQPSQQQFGQQMPGQQRLTDQRVRQFFGQVEHVLQQTARTQDPAALQQYMQQFMWDDAVITSASELYIGDRHIATTIAHITEEAASEALGHAASALQGRKLVSDYEISIRVQNVQLMPGQQSARVSALIQESGLFGGPDARRMAQAWGRQQMGMGGMQGQMQGAMGQPQFGQTQPGTGQPQQGTGQRLGIGEGRQDGGQMGPMPMQRGGGFGMGPGRGGALEQGIRFTNNATCMLDVSLDQGQIRIGNTYCRSIMRIGA